MIFTLILHWAAMYISEERSYRNVLADEKRNFLLFVQLYTSEQRWEGLIEFFVPNNNEEIAIEVYDKIEEKILYSISGHKDEFGGMPVRIFRLNLNSLVFEEISPGDHKHRSNNLDENGYEAAHDYDGHQGFINNEERIRFIYETSSIIVTYERDIDSLNNSLSETLYGDLLTIMTLALLAFLIITLLLFGKFLAPINTITRNIKNVREKGIEEEITILRTGDEFEELSRSFSEMMEKIRGQWEEQKRFIDDASHELKTPLTILEGYGNLLDRKRNDPKFIEEYIAVIQSEQKRMRELIASLLELSRNSDPQKQKNPINPSPVVGGLIDIYRKLFPDFCIEFKEQDSSFVTVNEKDFDQILRILLDNAVKYSTDRKKIEVKINKKTITVYDEGEGIPKEEISHIFDRFYRVQNDRSRETGGNGLGLAILKKLCRENDISVKVDSKVGSCTKFILEFRL